MTSSNLIGSLHSKVSFKMSGFLSFRKIIPIDIENMSLKQETPAVKYVKYNKLHFISSYVFGLNRVYILNCNRIITVLSSIYTFALFVYSTGTVFTVIGQGSIITLVRYSFTAQFGVLVVNAYVNGRKHLLKYYKRLNRFDEMLKIKDGQIHTFSSWWLLLSFVSELMDYYYLASVYYDAVIDHVSMVSLMWLLNRDAEVMFFLNNLCHLYQRVMVLKLHVLKMFDTKKTWFENEDKNLRSVEHLCRRVELDIGALHKAYETLHKCSVHLNCLMFVPFFTVFLTTAVTIIFSAKGTVKAIEASEAAELLNIGTNFTAIVQIFRCFKYIMIIFLPSYLAGVAKSEVSAIRGILYDVIRSNRLDPVDLKRTKAFLELVKDSNFSYLMMNYNMDMTLPLRFLNVCLTYFIIVMNFSKFID